MLDQFMFTVEIWSASATGRTLAPTSVWAGRSAPRAPTYPSFLPKGVAELAADVDFDVWVVDDREQYCNPERFPAARRLIVAPIDNALSGLEIDSNTMCIIVTRGHNHDEEALYHIAEKPSRYVGMIGSRRKIRLIFEDLLREGIPRDRLERVHAPLGFDIGSQTVPEIAVSILAELIAHRNLGGTPERPRPDSILSEIAPG